MVQRRSYWWRRGSRDDDKPKKEEKKKEEKKEPDKVNKVEKPTFQTSARRPYKRNIVEKSLIFNADMENNEFGKMGFAEAPVVVGGGGGNDMGYDFNIKDFFHLHYEVNDSLVLPALPLPSVPLLPGVIQKFTVTDRLTIQKLKEIQPKDNIIGLFLQKNPPKYTTSVVNDLSEIYPIGTYSFVPLLLTISCAEFRDLRMTGNSASLIVSGLARIRIDSMVEKGPPMIVKASKLPYLSENLDEITMKAYSNELLSYVDLLMAQNPLYKQLFASFEKEYSGSRDPLYLANLAGYMPFAKREDLQKVRFFKQRMRDSCWKRAR